MSHIDPAVRAALVKNKWSVFWGTTLVVAVAMVIIAAANFASNAESSISGATNVYWQGSVGEKDEVKIVLPPRSWWDIDTNKTIIVRLKNNELYEKRADGSTYKIEPGKLTQVESVGDTVPGGGIYLLAKKGEKMAKVSVMTVRK